MPFQIGDWVRWAPGHAQDEHMARWPGSHQIIDNYGNMGVLVTIQNASKDWTGTFYANRFVKDEFLTLSWRAKHGS